MSINDVAAELDAAIGQIDAGIAILSRVVADWDEAISLATAVTAGSSRPEAAQALNLLTQARQSVVSVLGMAQSARDSARSYRVHLTGGGPPPAATLIPPVPDSANPPSKRAGKPDISKLGNDGSSTDRPAAPPTGIDHAPSGVANRHGDRYPEDALPYSDDLPPRVRTRQPNSPPMTGVVEVGGRSYGEISATTTDTWAQEVMARAKTLGFRDAATRMLYNHVEMKTVSMMVRSRATSARVVINHAPCGSEPDIRGGCHAYLPYFIPKGSSLTVLGTDANGNPFRRKYEGRANH